MSAVLDTLLLLCERPVCMYDAKVKVIAGHHDD